MFAAMVNPELGGYDKNLSLLLLSPSITDVRSALESILYGTEQVIDFTLFFAGHGGVVHDALYLCLRDTKLSSIAISGLGFAELARIVVAAKPSQANFVLDACNSAGLGYDLAAILRQSLTGTAETTGVAALAAAAADEYAAEVPEGGAFTTALLRVLQGHQFVQRQKPYLDIPEIGAVLRPDVEEDQRQTVSAWVLNLQGPNRFSFNPHYHNDMVGHHGYAIEALGKRLSLTKADVAAAKRATLELQGKVDEQRLAQELERLSANLHPEEATLLLAGLAEGMAEQARNSPDPFAEGRVLGVFLGQLLRFAEHPGAARRLTTLRDRAATADLAALRKLDDQLREYRYRLLSADSLADLYFLPLRVADVLGRIGASLLLNDLTDLEVQFLSALTRTLLDFYGNSIVALSEEQAAPLAIFITVAWNRGWIDLAEEIIGRLYNDAVENFGRVARHFLDGEKTLAVLDERYRQNISLNGNLYHRPSDLLSVILVLASLTNLDEAIDASLIQIDHTPLNVFIPETPLDLGCYGPIRGKNLGFAVGHKVWRCIDMRREWYSEIRPLLQCSQIDEPKLRSAVVLAVLSMRDRVPWFLVADGFRADESAVFTRISID